MFIDGGIVRSDDSVRLPRLRSRYGRPYIHQFPLSQRGIGRKGKAKRFLWKKIARVNPEQIRVYFRKIIAVTN